MSRYIEVSENAVYMMYGLRRINHDVDKASDSINQWVGAITYETTVSIVIESSVARDLESLLIMGKLPIIGHMPSLRGIRFHWDSRKIGDGDDATLQEYCRVALKYISQMQPLRHDEIQTRLSDMGYADNEQ